MLLASTLLLGDTVWPAWLAAAIGGMQAGVVGIVLRAVWRLGRATAGHHREGLAIAGGASLGAACGVPFAVGLLGGAAVMLALQLPRRLFAYGGERRGNPALLGLAVGGWLFVAWLTASPTPATTAGNTAPLLAAAVTPTALELGTTGLRAGLLSFGGAYTTIPFLQADAVGPPGWMSEAQFVAGLSVGSVLPAPLVIVGTWVGFAGGGWPGALLLTLGIFGPAFLFPLLLHHQLERLVANRALHACLDGIAAAVLGLLVVTAGQLATGLWERDAGALWLGGLALAVVATWQHRLATPLALLACALLAAGTRGPA
jgi:chromate transporter